MIKENQKNSSWDFYSKLILMSYSVLQIMRWRILPQFMDIYYHLLTAWGFVRAGGYSGWDSWQYAPFGRIHTYPPFFHLILAFLIKLGISKIILAKFFETIMPVLFLIVLWYFIRRNYSSRLGFFILLACSSSFSFYLSLINYLPATLAIIIGLLTFDQLFQNRLLRSALLLALCFYTHIGISIFFILSIVFYGLINRQYRKPSLMVCISAIALSIPILFKQLVGLKFISIFGISNENYFCEFKIIEYALALFGLSQILRMTGKYRLFLAFFLASFIFLIYPYRFFSAQGYLPIIFLAGISMDAIYEKFQEKRTYLKYLSLLLAIYLLFFSPTILMEKSERANIIDYKAIFADSALTNMIFPALNERAFSSSLWLPTEYLPITELIKHNSGNDDIIYSSIYYLGVCFASISERATANGLFPEIDASKKFDRLSAAKIIIALQDDDPRWLDYIVDKYNLVKRGENKLFIVYENPLCHTKVSIKKASVDFGGIGFISLAFILLFWIGKKLKS